ncbi:hypothetical protein Lal_00018521 [Lupinus albus]|nr:hypothetical protein Lal_00018521 [Lupinus albus]
MELQLLHLILNQVPSMSIQGKRFMNQTSLGINLMNRYGNLYEDEPNNIMAKSKENYCLIHQLKGIAINFVMSTMKMMKTFILPSNDILNIVEHACDIRRESENIEMLQHQSLNYVFVMEEYK